MTEVNPCNAGSSTENPCWRPATERMYPEDKEPNLCAEHALLCRLSEEKDDWWHALGKAEGWAREAESYAASGHLERLAVNMRAEVRLEYAAAAAKAYAARLVADQGPPEEGEPALTLEQSEVLARLNIRADAFANARTIIEDLSEDAELPDDKWVTIDALASAVDVADEEASLYKRALGLKD
jgi:hypothetical protein